MRASVMGGLSCIFQPFAQANNPELGLDFKAMSDAEEVSYLLLVDCDFPRSCTITWTGLPPRA